MGAPAGAVAGGRTFAPGIGVGDIAIGNATLDDVLRTYGCADWRFTWTGVHDERILVLRDRGNHADRPESFYFDKVQRVEKIALTSYSRGIVSAKGNGVWVEPSPEDAAQGISGHETPLQAFIDELGPPAGTKQYPNLKSATAEFGQGLRVTYRTDQDDHPTVGIEIVAPVPAK